MQHHTMTFTYIALSLLLVGVLPAQCRDAARACSCMQQDGETLPALEQELSTFYQDLAQTSQGQENRLLALEEQNKGLLQAIGQQGAAHMQAVQEAVEAGLQAINQQGTAHKQELSAVREVVVEAVVREAVGAAVREAVEAAARLVVEAAVKPKLKPAQCQDEARACMQQDDGSPLDLEHQLSMFLEDLAQTIHSQDERLLALERQNEGLLQAISQQGAAHMQELGVVREAVEAGLRWQLKPPSEGDVRSGIPVRAARTQENCDKAQFNFRFILCFVWFYFKMVFVLGLAFVCFAAVMIFMENHCKPLGYQKAEGFVTFAVAALFVSLAAYCIYRFYLDMIRVEFKLLI